MPLNVFTYYDNIGVLPMVLKHLGINFKVLGVYHNATKCIYIL
nr:MAG TPA: hypothetical protein [Caudoviricetes sp.]